MALAVTGQPNNPTLSLGNANNPTLSPNVITATPGSNGFAGLTNLQPKSSPTPVASPDSSIANALNNLASQQAANLALQRQIAAEENAQPGYIDVNSIRSQAAQQAANNVNPYYTQVLNQYLANEKAQADTATAQRDLALQGAQSQLANTQAQNTQQQQFTGQNTALNIGNINTQAANRQQNSGNSFEQNRIQLEQKIGQSGLGASGIGQQQVWQARNQANTQELQAQDSDTYNTNQQLLNESNTFAQLAQSNQYASTVEGQSETKAKLTLSSFLQQQAAADLQYRNEVRSQQQNELQLQTEAATKTAIFNAMQKYKSNPFVYNKTIQAYGGL